jgi:hypothetical protein
MRTFATRLGAIALALMLACSGDDDPSGAPDAGDKPDAAEPGNLCGGLAGAQCAATAYCDYKAHSCGSSDASGTCEERPDVCPDLIDPVCGCDGMVYQNECKANLAGVDPSATAECNAPPDRIRCGYRFCKAGDTCKTVGEGDDLDYTCDAA